MKSDSLLELRGLLQRSVKLIDEIVDCEDGEKIEELVIRLGVNFSEIRSWGI